MRINYNAQRQIFKLDTESTSYIMIVRRNGYLQHLYYGAYIGDDDLEYMFSDVVNESFSPWAPSADVKYFALDTQPQEYSCNGSGDYRISAFSVETATGNSTTALKYVSHEITDGKKALPGLPAVYADGTPAKTLEITMSDAASGAVVVLSYSILEGFDAIMRSVKVKNTSDKPFFIEKVYSTCVDFNDKDYDLIHLYGTWATERYEERKPLLQGIQEIASKRGSSSHNHNPFVTLCRHNTTEDHGDCYGFALCYSGNFSAKIEVDTFDQTRLMMGINPEDFKWKLCPSEEFTAPEAIMVYSCDGLGGMSRIFHKLIRKHICRGKFRDARRPILIN
ncbi:MAG: alpha-galactosidase, partial [Clostridia bacterium]|nr:alpha-galactosidase [Clostridia bacterium]